MNVLRLIFLLYIDRMLFMENISRIIPCLEFLQAREIVLVHVFACELGQHPRIRVDETFDDIFANCLMMLFTQELDHLFRSSHGSRSFFFVAISVAEMRLDSVLLEDNQGRERGRHTQGR